MANLEVREHVFEKRGKYYRQYATWSEKYGIYVAQTPRRISKAEYEKCRK